MRRLELVATGNIPIFDATATHQYVACSAEAAPVASGASLFPGGTRMQLHGAGFEHVEYVCLRRELVVTVGK